MTRIRRITAAVVAAAALGVLTALALAGPWQGPETPAIAAEPTTVAAQPAAVTVESGVVAAEPAAVAIADPDATVAPDVVEQIQPGVAGPAPGLAPLSDRYGVWIGDGDIRQVRQLGLQWWLSFDVRHWVLGKGDRFGRIVQIPAGETFPMLVPMRTSDRLSEADITTIVRRYPGLYWVLGNEPNVVVGEHWESLSPEEYARSLAYYAATVKRIDPSAKLVGPNVLNWWYTCNGCGGFTNGEDWTAAMRTAYLREFRTEPPFDIWAIHTYDLDWAVLPQGNADLHISQIQSARDWIDSFPALRGKPMWISEIGIHWGYPGMELGPDGRFRGVGGFDYNHVETYMRTLFGFLNQNAAAMNIQKWFLAGVSTSPNSRENWYDKWSGITLMDGTSVDAPVTRLGRLYQQLAGVR